jgi:NTP pyrophosphatase (non-canonical NTP hydrolase)
MRKSCDLPEEDNRAFPRNLQQGLAEVGRIMNDAIHDLTQRLLHFRAQRDWQQFHNPKDQILSLCLEAAEVLELTQWKNGAELDAHLTQHKDKLADELADVFGWLLLIANDQGIDLREALAKKIVKNEAKYPVDKARGRADKYTEYEGER